MTRWLVLSAFVAATALGACRSGERGNAAPPSAMPVEQTDTTPTTKTPGPSTAPPRDSPSAAGTESSTAPPPGTAGKAIPPTHPVKPDEPGEIEQDSRDRGSDSRAGSGNRDFGRSP